MDLGSLIGASWAEHGGAPERVWARLRAEALPLVTKPADAPGLAALAAHVAGEHLGRWDEGLAFLEELARRSLPDASAPEAKSVARLQAVLHRCKGDRAAEARCLEAGRSGGALPPESDRVRVLAIAAAALAGQKRTREAISDWKEALAAASYGPGPQDPAARALAVTGNNLACELEEKAELSPEERQLLLEAAWTARRYWAVAGGWQEVERAEYRLAITHLKLGANDRALEHAASCLAIVRENGEEAEELFYAHEALARAARARGDVARAKREREAAAEALRRVADEGFREAAGADLAKLDRSLEGA